MQYVEPMAVGFGHARTAIARCVQERDKEREDDRPRDRGIVVDANACLRLRATSGCVLSYRNQKQYYKVLYLAALRIQLDTDVASRRVFFFFFSFGNFYFYFGFSALFMPSLDVARCSSIYRVAIALKRSARSLSSLHGQISDSVIFFFFNFRSLFGREFVWPQTLSKYTKIL